MSATVEAEPIDIEQGRKMKNARRALIGLSAVAALGLTGCAGGDDSTAQDTESANTNPVLRVTETPTQDRIAFTVSPGTLPENSTVTVSAYGGGFKNANPVCTGQPIVSTSINTGGAKDPVPGVINRPGVGSIRLVMSAPGYATPCQASKPLVVKWEPDWDIETRSTLSGPAKTVPKGKPFSVGVVAKVGEDSRYSGESTGSVTVTARGPYASLPELQAAQCGDSAPTAATATYTYTYTDPSSGRMVDDPKLTAAAPGVYWIKVESKANAQIQAGSTTSCKAGLEHSVVNVQ